MNFLESQPKLRRAIEGESISSIGGFPSQISDSARSLPLSLEVVESEVLRLYEKNVAALIKYGLAICGDLAMAEDAVQEAFLRYYIALRKETAQMDSKGWLYSTTRNYILDRLKEYGARHGKSLEAAAHISESTGNPESAIMLREINATAQDLLSPRERECLRLRNEGLRYREIADILKIDTATVGVLLGRAMKKIRVALDGNHGEKK